MKNKLLSLLTVFALCLPVLLISKVSYAEENADYTSETALVNALMNTELSMDNADKAVTRRQAVLLALKLHMKEFTVFDYNGEFADITSDDPDAGKLALAAELGIISKLSTGRFNPDTKVSYNEALKMIFNSLGYGSVIRISGKGDSSYHSLANRYDVCLTPKNSYALTYGEMAYLMLKALDTPVLEENGINEHGEILYSSSPSVTPLTKYYGIYKEEGLVSQNNMTSLYEKTALGGKGIRINTMVLNCPPDIDTEVLLGRNIIAYYSDDGKMLKYHTFTDDDDVLVLNCEDIDSYNNNTYKYFENNKEKKVTTVAAPAIIYNGVALTTEDSALIEAGEIFIPENGIVELIKDNSGKYGVIKITNYETYIVQGVDIDGRKIVDKYGKSVLDLNTTENLSMKNTDGEDVDFDYISYMNIVSVARASNGKSATVIVSNSAVQGVLTTFNEHEVQIEGEVYKISDRMKEILTTNPMPELNEEIILYFDFRGNAAVCEISPNNGWNFGYIIDKCETTGLDKAYLVKMLTSDSKIEELAINKNIRIDGEGFGGSASDAASVITVETPVKYRLNVYGEIRELDTPTVGPKEKITSLKASYSSDTARWVDYISSFAGATFIKSGSVTFTVPETPTGNDKDYMASKVESSFAKDIDYKVETFMEDPSELVDTLVVKKGSVSNTVSGADIITVVDRVEEALDDEGNVVTKIYGMNAGIMRDYIVDDETIYNPATDDDPLERGDLIRINANSRREVVAMQRCFDNDTRTMHSQLGGTNPSLDNLDVIFRLSYGKVLNMKNNLLQVRLDNDSETEEKYYINGTVVVVGKNEIRAGSLSDIVSDTTAYASSKVVVEMRYMRIRTIIIYKDI